MINNIAYVKNVEVSFEFAGIYHDIRSKLELGFKLKPKERSFYLLFMATPEEIKEYLTNERKDK